MVPPHFCLKLKKVDDLDLMTRSHTYWIEKCLTEDQAKHIYKKAEMYKPVNIETMAQEIEHDKVTGNRLKEEEDENEINPYQMAILKKKSREDIKIEQMINWSIFSDLIKYVDGSSCLDVTPSLMVRPLDDRKHRRLCNNLKIYEDLTVGIIFEEDRIRDAYFDKHDGIHAAISQVTKFNESTELSTMYLGKTDMTREHVIKAEEKFPISGQGFTNGKLLDQTEFASIIQRVQVGNRQYVAVLFVILVITDIHGHRFKVFTLVSEMHDNVDLVLGMKNVFELEGVIDMQESSFKFLNRSLPFFSKEQVVVKPKERNFVMTEAPFADEISGLAIVKMLDNR